jgi:hypothetical protein
MMEGEYSPADIIGMMKVIHCLSQDDFHLMMEPELHKTFPSIKAVQSTGVESYLNGKFMEMKQNMFTWLCSLDPTNQVKVFEFASKKLMWSKLNKRNRV